VDKEFLEEALYKRAIKGGSMALIVKIVKGGAIEKDN
jgi:hypothetical protein